jgi:HK97 family phage prohead protease
MNLLVGNTVNYKRSSAAAGSGSGHSKAKANDRVVVGLCAVIGNVDAVNDRVAPGAFDNAIALFKAGRSRCRFLWSHASGEPPIAKILDLKEVGRADLPPVLRENPDVAGALQVTRQYLTDEYAERVYQGVVSGAITEMSFAYTVDAFHYEEGPEGTKICVLDSLSLMDASDVNWGCNPATMASIKGPTILTTERLKQLTESAVRRRKVAELRASTDFLLSTPEQRALAQSGREIERLKRWADRLPPLNRTAKNRSLPASIQRDINNLQLFLARQKRIDSLKPLQRQIDSLRSFANSHKR